MTIYTSAFSHQQSIKNQEKHTENSGKQVVWVTVNKEREMKGLSHGNWHSGRCISSSQTHNLSLVFTDVFPKYLILVGWKGTLKNTELPGTNDRHPTAYNDAPRGQ